MERKHSSPPHLHAINTSDIGYSLESPPSSSNLPSFRVSLSPNPSDLPSVSEAWSNTAQKSKINSRAKNESRKLFAHVLGQLERRPMPPPVFDAFVGPEMESSETNLGALVETVKGAVKSKVKRQEKKPRVSDSMAAPDDDSDDGGEGVFTTDVTYDLMLQLKDVLIMSAAQGWHIFDDGCVPSITACRVSSQFYKPYPRSLPEKDHSEKTEKPTSPFRRSRNSLQPGGRRSQSTSPSRGKQVQAPELLSLSISILATVVLEDCRYKISSPRPSRPPNALQALSLDTAQYLLHAHRHDPQIISSIGFAMIPAFSTFQPEMHTRLLAFFEDGVIRGILRDLSQIQGVDRMPAGIRQQGREWNQDDEHIH